jgi:hypothetical protein
MSKYNSRISKISEAERIDFEFLATYADLDYIQVIKLESKI